MKNLVLLHGALGSKDQLEPLGLALKENYHIYRFNFPGHGGEPIDTTQFSIAGFAEALERYVLQNNISNPSVFGYSMGGFVALYAAAEKRVAFEKIITLATKFEWSPEIALKETAMLDPGIIETKVPAFAEILSTRYAPQDWKEHLTLTSKLMINLGNDNPLTAAKLASLKQPCLLLLGDHDKMVSQLETESVSDLVPVAQVKILPNTGHPIEKADVGLLAAAIDTFLTQ